MLPSDLNKFKHYLDDNTNYCYEDMGKILEILEDNKTRSHFLIAISKLGHLTKNKPNVQVKQCISTTSQYIKNKIIITTYYTDHIQHYNIGRCIQKLNEKNCNDNLVLLDAYRPAPDGNGGNSRGTKISG